MNPLMVILGMVAFLFVVFWFLKTVVFRILYFAAPFLLIGALILNYRVVLGYGKWLLDTVKNNLLMGIVAIALSIVCYPFVSAFLAFRAYQLRGESFKRKKSKSGDYINFKDVDEDFLDISREKVNREEIEQRFSDL